MPIKYKIDVIAALKEAGYNTTRIRKEKIMGEAMLQKIRSGQMVSWPPLKPFVGCSTVSPAIYWNTSKRPQAIGNLWEL